MLSPEKALPRVSVVETLVASLSSRILDGELPPGTQLREVEVAEAYGAARNTVRTAFQALVRDGLLQHHKHRGVFVAESGPAEVADVYALRRAIELEATSLVIRQRRSLDGVERAVDALERLPDGAPWRDVIKADLATHQAIVDAAGSRRMSTAFSSLVAELRLYLAAFPGKDFRRRTVAAEHRRLAAVIASGDEDAAREQVGEHLRESLEDFLRRSESGEAGGLSARAGAASARP